MIDKGILKRIFAITTMLLMSVMVIPAYSQTDLYGLWVQRAVSGSLGSANIKKTFTDKEGNVYVAGYFQGKMNFNDNICSPIYEEITNTQEGAFLSKYSSDGNFMWKVHFYMDKLPNYSIPTLNIEDAIYLDKRGMVVIDLTSASIDLTNLGVCPPTLHAKHAGGVESFINNCTTPCSSPSPVWIGIGGLFFIDTNTGVIVNKKQHDCLEEWTMFDINANGDLLRSFYLDSKDGLAHKASYLQTYNGITGTLMSSKPYPIAEFFENYNATANQAFAPDGTIYALFRKNEGSVDGKPILTSSLTKTDAAFTGYTAQKTILAFHKDSPQNPLNPTLEMATDASSQLYVGFNFPHHNATISDLMTQGIDFSSKQGYEKAVVMKLNDNLIHQWSFQLGENSTSDESKSVIKNIKVYNNLLYVVGTFNGTVNFNPQGVAMQKTATNDDGFYAIYDLDGVCQKVILFDGPNNESIESLSFINATNLILGGSYSSLTFQADPSQRLLPITSNGTSQGFIGSYSMDPLSTPTPTPSSYGDAPPSYGLAAHYAYPCLRIGGLDMNKVQSMYLPSVNANTAENDDGISISTKDGYTDLKTGGLQLITGDKMQAYVMASNGIQDQANLIAWIDFNQNGIFDPSEASSLATIAGGTSNQSAILIWDNVSSRIKQGKTYMRIRITNNNMDANQATGLFFNGEVEDYVLNFDPYEIQKTATLSNGKTEAAIGDTISYSLKIKSEIPNLDNFEIFDPIPSYTQFVPTSESPTSNFALEIVNYMGTSALAAHWKNVSMPADSTFRFKVVVTDLPPDSIVYNIGFAVFRGDTISSAEKNCFLSTVKIEGLKAIDDCIGVMFNTTIPSVNIAINDTDPDRNFVRDTILNNGLSLKGGTVTLNALHDGTLTYQPAPSFVGVDTIKYRIKTKSDSADAIVKIAVMKFKSDKYEACPGDNITVGMQSIANVQYTWYADKEGVEHIGTGDDITLTVTHDTVIYINATIDGCDTKAFYPLQITTIKYLKHYPDIRIQVCPNPSRSIYLSSYIDTAYFSTIQWDKVSPASTNIDPITGEIATNNLPINGMHVYKYTATNACTSSTARAYVKTIGTFVNKTDTIEVCKDQIELSLINLKQMFGLEADGNITTTTIGAQAYLKHLPSHLIFRDAYYFESIAAYNDPAIAIYNSNHQSKKIEFLYTPSLSSCVSTPIKLVLIITGSIL